MVIVPPVQRWYNGDQMDIVLALSLCFVVYVAGRVLAVLLLDGIEHVWGKWNYYRWIRQAWRDAQQEPPSWWALIKGH